MCNHLYLQGLAGRRSSLPLSPPSPHTFRRPAPDAVAFHIQPDVEDGRVSFLSVQDHVYEVIPGEDSTSSDDAFDAFSPDSSPVSHSTTSDDSLLHIACPSSDSSLPEGYLHPVVSPEEASSEPEMMGESMTDLHGYNNETSAAPARSDPPYENVGNAP
ncbi:uncharacterized protein [Littorina saxatilis]|uniref:uncharacterized protein n=1 Tax=Littorina saxatilis TaxID=31220 RepID=UPI0038B66187